MKKGEIKLLSWGFVIGAIVMLIFIFASGWAVTRGSAKAKGEEMAKQAVIDQLAPICVEQFLQDPNREELFKKLEKESSWRRGDTVKEAGWAAMPGAKSPAPGVADECAKRLIELKKTKK